ncbi:MAG: hypothetical protein GXY83_24680 [Rhodopirellula sp.]|nr:hypothetical protein [Rhodopirellula sp.]
MFEIEAVLSAAVFRPLAYIGPEAGFTVLSSIFILLVTLVLLFVTILAWPLRFDYKILFVERDLDEVLLSQEKMLRRRQVGEGPPRNLMKAHFERHRQRPDGPDRLPKRCASKYHQ